MMPDTSIPNTVAKFHLRDRLARTRWNERRPVMTLHGWSIYVDPQDMPTWNAWIRREDRIVVVGSETYLILSGHAQALARFTKDFVDWPKDGLIYLPIDGSYRDAAVLYSKLTGNDVARGKDAITALEERSERLLAHASDLVASPDDHVLHQTVVSELALVADDLAELEARMAKLRTVVDLAGIYAESSVA